MKGKSQMGNKYYSCLYHLDTGRTELRNAFNTFAECYRYTASFEPSLTLRFIQFEFKGKEFHYYIDGLGFFHLHLIPVLDVREDLGTCSIDSFGNITHDTQKVSKLKKKLHNYFEKLEKPIYNRTYSY